MSNTQTTASYLSASQTALMVNTLSVQRNVALGKVRPTAVVPVPTGYQPGDSAAVMMFLQETDQVDLAEFLRQHLFVHEHCASCQELLTPAEFSAHNDTCAKCQ